MRRHSKEVVRKGRADRTMRRFGVGAMFFEQKK